MMTPIILINVKRVDFTTEELSWNLDWVNHNIKFIAIIGHSSGTGCVVIGDLAFGGDTLIPFMPFIKKRNGGSKEQFQESVKKLVVAFSADTFVYFGHGKVGKIKDCQTIG